jgi:hypothetical protein
VSRRQRNICSQWAPPPPANAPDAANAAGAPSTAIALDGGIGVGTLHNHKNHKYDIFDTNDFLRNN